MTTTEHRPRRARWALAVAAPDTQSLYREEVQMLERLREALASTDVRPPIRRWTRTQARAAEWSFCRIMESVDILSALVDWRLAVVRRRVEAS